MSSRFYPSLADAIWSGSPTPEWLSGTEDSAWKQTIAAMQQLWRDIGSMGVGASCPVAWWPLQKQSRTAREREEERDILPGQRWLFTSNLSVGNLSQPHQIVVPVMPRDTLKDEQFFAVITTAFSAVALKAAHPETGDRGVTFSFEPQVIRRVWRALRTRVQAVRQDSVDLWDAVLEDYPLLPPDYRVLSRFSSLLMMSAHDRLPMPENHPEQQLFLMPPSLDFVEEIPQVRIPVGDTQPSGSGVVSRLHTDRESQEQTSNSENAPPEPLSESEFLRAIAHEVQTPLATIRTLTRLLLRRDDLTPLCRRYVENIERECTEQIDRFGLFFRATELDPDKIRLRATSLTELLQANQPRWTQHVERRGSTFELDIPEDSPSIVSDPNTLDAMLTGVIDRISRGAPAGSHIVAKIVQAGEQVKLQFQVNNDEFDCGDSHVSTPLRALGQLLVVQPETGALSLSTSMTQQLFTALGAKFTVRQQPDCGETLTIYLPQHHEKPG